MRPLANTTVLRFGESMTSSIFCGNRRRVIENGRGALVATICLYTSTLTNHVQEEELGGGRGKQMKKHDGWTEGELLGRVGDGSKEGKGAWEQGGIQGCGRDGHISMHRSVTLTFQVWCMSIHLRVYQNIDTYHHIYHHNLHDELPTYFWPLHGFTYAKISWGKGGALGT